MRVAIYGRNITIKNFPKFYNNLIDSLEQHRIEFAAIETYQAFLEKQYSIQCPSCTTEELVSGQFDALISLGGDGTILDTLTLVGQSELPVMGINLGRLGFLANIQIEEVETAIKALISNDYRLDKRAVIEVESRHPVIQKFPYALNDVVVQKRDTSNMITVGAKLNDEFLNNYWADGLIVATPTGSSGYSLSCGGPLVFPRSQSYVITPIAAHNLSVRPIVVPDDIELTIAVDSRANHVLVTLDSRSFKIPAKSDLKIKKADFGFNMIQLKDQNYMDTIRNKLLWGQDVRD